MSLDPRTRALLERAKGGFEPTPHDAVVVEAALIAVVGATAAGAVTGAGKLATMGSATIARAMAGVFLVSGAIGGTLALARPASQETKSSPVTALSSPIVVRLTLVPPAPVIVEEPGETPAVATATARPRLAAHAGVPRAEPRAAKPQDTSSLSEELALVREGTSRLHAGNAVAALASFDSHAETFPRGLLEEERCAGRVLALCALGRKSDARDQAVALRVSHPASAHAARIRESCAGSW